jgi:hypothetical protein
MPCWYGRSSTTRDRKHASGEQGVLSAVLAAVALEWEAAVDLALGQDAPAGLWQDAGSHRKDAPTGRLYGYGGG